MAAHAHRPTKPRRRSRRSSSGMKKSPIRTRRAWRGSGWAGGRLAPPGGCAGQPLAQARHAGAAAERAPLLAEQRDPLAAAGQERRQREHQQDRPVLLGRQRGRRAPGHRRREVGPQPDALRRLPLLVAQEQLGRARRLAPVDPAGGIALLVGPELPERLADADPAAAMHALRHGRRRRARRRPAAAAAGRPAARPRWRRPVTWSASARAGERHQRDHRAQPLDHLIEGRRPRRAR